jgi:hypothetical protein
MEPATEEVAPASASASSPQPQSQSQLSSPHENGKTPVVADKNVSLDNNDNENAPDHDNRNGTPNPDSTTLESAASSTKSRPVSSVVPPFWQRHERSVSRASLSSLAQSRIIRLEDHTADPDSETSRGLWARSVAIDDHVVVQGKSGVGSYVVWNCVIQTLDVS